MKIYVLLSAALLISFVTAVDYSSSYARLELLFFFFRDSSFLQYKVFADIRRGSVQRRQETGQDRTNVTADD